MGLHGVPKEGNGRSLENISEWFEPWHGRKPIKTARITAWLLCFTNQPLLYCTEPIYSRASDIGIFVSWHRQLYTALGLLLYDPGYPVKPTERQIVWSHAFFSGPLSMYTSAASRKFPLCEHFADSLGCAQKMNPYLNFSECTMNCLLLYFVVWDADHSQLRVNWSLSWCRLCVGHSAASLMQC